MFDRLQAWAKQIKQDLVTLYVAARDPRTPRLAKAIALFVVAYAVSPIDLIPDFIPVIGLLDDIILVPLSIMLAVRLIPPPLWQEFRTAAERASSPRASLRWGAWIVISIWVVCAVIVICWLTTSATFLRNW